MFSPSPFADAPPPALQPPPAPHPSKESGVKVSLPAPADSPARVPYPASKAGQLTLSMPASAEGPVPMLPVFTTLDAGSPLTNVSASHATVAFCVAGSRTSRCSGVSLEHCAAASVATTAKRAMHDSGSMASASVRPPPAERSSEPRNPHSPIPKPTSSPPKTALADPPCPPSVFDEGLSKLFVGQLPQRPDVQPWLEALFKPYGVQEVQVRRVTAFDKRGEAWEKPVAAFVWVKTREAAEVAVAKLHHHEYKNGRLWFKLSVEMAHS